MHAMAKTKAEQMDVIQGIFKKEGFKWKVAVDPNLKFLRIPFILCLRLLQLFRLLQLLIPTLNWLSSQTLEGRHKLAVVPREAQARKSGYG